jgi:hypothetical protein
MKQKRFISENFSFCSPVPFPNAPFSLRTGTTFIRRTSGRSLWKWKGNGGLFAIDEHWRGKYCRNILVVKGWVFVSADLRGVF